MKFVRILIVFTFNILTVIYAQGFGSSGALDARNIGLGGTNATSARGVYAIGVNPANLVINNGHKIEFSTVFPLPSVNLNVGNDFITLEDYKHFFTGVEGTDGEISGRYLNDSEKGKFLDLFDQGSMINTNLGINLFSVTIYPSKKIGAFGFAMQDWTSAQVSLPKQVF